MEKTLFHGKWITDGTFADLRPLEVFHRENEPSDVADRHPEEYRNRHFLFRRTFSLQKTAGRYTLRFSADDYAKVRINGVPASQGPALGYPWAYSYLEKDVTDLLRDGENEITAHVYYQGLINRVWVSGDLRSGFIADLISPAGEVLLSTDGEWEVAPIPQFVGTRKIGYDTQYAEDYDARVPHAPFAPARVRTYDDIRFAAAPATEVVTYPLSPAREEKLPGGGIFYDFGQEIVGTLTLCVCGNAGDTVRVLAGEETEDTPEKVRYLTRCCCEYDETLTLGAGETVWEQYDYKGFRYVTLLPSAQTMKVKEITCTVRHAPFDDDACTLDTDNERLAGIFRICKNGVKYGTQETYVDCPTREKGQYAGDMTVTSAAQLWLTGDVALLEKGIRDQAESAKIDDGLMAVMGAGLMQEIADYSLQFPLLLLRHYGFTKNKEFLAQMLPVAEKMFAHFSRYKREDGLLASVTDKWNLVDWPENLRDGYDFPLTRPVGEGCHNVINAFYAGCAKNLAEIRAILGLPTDGTAEEIAAAYKHAFFRYDLGVFTDTESTSHASLHANAVAAFYGLVPEGYEMSVGNFLVEKGMVCGVYMAYFLLRGLCRIGRFEDAWRLMLSDGEHSWAQMLREGATACFEAWGKDQKWNTSFCHPWASAPITLLIEDFCGISPDGTQGECHLPPDAGKIQMTIPTAKGSVRFRSPGK